MDTIFSEKIDIFFVMIFFCCILDGYGYKKRLRGASTFCVYLLVFILFVDGHFINEVLATTELVDDEEDVADIYRDATLEVVVEVDVAAE